MKGKVHKFGDDVNTDLIIPARYLNTTDAKELASHCMEDADPEFTKKHRPGDIIVGGRNFGCGSSREHAPLAIKTAGISCVVAKSFARIFFRNCINTGLPIIVSEEAAGEARSGDEMEVDLAKGTLRNLTRNRTYSIPPFPREMQEIIEAGGLMEFVKKSMASKACPPAGRRG
jgi:3-isopropylmalate/(R)-2-methylmalate dehydratase small subunit